MRHDTIIQEIGKKGKRKDGEHGESISKFKKLIPVRGTTGQQRLKSAEKDIEKALQVEIGSKAFLGDAVPAVKISIFSETQSGFAQSIQVERGHIFNPGFLYSNACEYSSLP